MKYFLAITALFLSVAASADSACTALSGYVGTYKLVSSTCQGPFGDNLTVAPYTDRGVSGYWLTSAGISMGPSFAANDSDKCTVSGNTVTVQTCGHNDNGCIPRYWVYGFSGTSATFQANGCVAQFTKTN